jgi:mannose-6-phosphate isomerase-like protein (cupin superfamily)
MRNLFAGFLLVIIGSSAMAQDVPRKIEPTWLRRDVGALHEHATDITTLSCHYTPIFGEGDSEAGSPKTFTRFGLLTIDPQGACKLASYSRIEELYFVRDGAASLGYSEETHALGAEDFTYIPPTVSHTLSNPNAQAVHLILISSRIPPKTALVDPPKLAVANLRDLTEQKVGGHPSSVLYKLMVGPRVTKRDRINATYNIADFFLMDFAPAGTNFPHHHETAEEIYLVMDGEGQMSAGSGTDGIQGLHPAKAGDAYFFRVNCTVGFYNVDKPDAKAHILAVRAYVPMPTELD